ncbi:MAG TPA: ATP-binding protein [Caulobacteraceae bacterium]
MAALFVAAAAATGVIAYASAQAQVDAAYDAQMRMGARMALALTSEELAQAAASRSATAPTPLLSDEDRRALDQFSDWPVYRIWRGGRLAVDSGSIKGLATTPSATDGFSTVSASGGRLRLYTQHVPPQGASSQSASGQGLVIQIGERPEVRTALVSHIALRLALPVLLAAPIIGLVMLWSLRQGLWSLRRVVDGLALRSAYDLTPLDAVGWPADLAALAASINALLARLDAALAKERRFVDAAAHQLRAPLAALKSEAVQLAGQADPAQRDALVQGLGARVEDASEVVEQLLLLARIEFAESLAEPHDLVLETALAIADLENAAETAGVTVTFEPHPASVLAPPGLIRTVAGNLLDNAIAHSPRGASVAVTIEPLPEGPRLRVLDHGAGMSPADRARAFDRFYRGPGAASGSAGLGLSIVAEAVKVMGGQVRLGPRDDGRSGLVAEVVWPRMGRG